MWEKTCKAQRLTVVTLAVILLVFLQSSSWINKYFKKYIKTKTSLAPYYLQGKSQVSWPGRQIRCKAPFCPISCCSFKSIYAPSSLELCSVFQRGFPLLGFNIFSQMIPFAGSAVFYYFCLVPSSSFSMSLYLPWVGLTLIVLNHKIILYIYIGSSIWM